MNNITKLLLAIAACAPVIGLSHYRDAKKEFDEKLEESHLLEYTGLNKKDINVYRTLDLLDGSLEPVIPDGLCSRLFPQEWEDFQSHIFAEGWERAFEQFVQNPNVLSEIRKYHGNVLERSKNHIVYVIDGLKDYLRYGILQKQH